MMDIETIVAMNKEAGNKAKWHGEKPTTFDEVEILQIKEGDFRPLKHINNLGNYVPKGWKRFDVNQIKDFLKLPYDWKFLKKGGLFVDSSGMGSDGEPALSLRQFVETVSKILEFNKDFGFAIYSEGQFQISVGVYEKA